MQSGGLIPILIILFALVILGGIVVLRRRLQEANPLLRALQRRSQSRALELIEAGADVNVTGKHGTTALMYAARQGDLRLVEALAQRGADLNDGSLLRAAEGGYVDMVQFLLRSGADVDVPTKAGTTPLVYAAWKGHASIVDLLISAGANENVEPKTGSPLAHAVERGHINIVDRLLRCGADPNNRDNKGRTPLMKCVDAAIVRADVNHNFNWALAKTLVDMLLKAGADAKAEDNQGRNALEGIVGSAAGLISGRKNKEPLLLVLRTFVGAGVDTSGALRTLAYWRSRERIAPRIFDEMQETLVQSGKT